MDILPPTANLPDNLDNQHKQLSVEVLISQAIDKNLPVEALERLLEMAMKMKALDAEEQFYKALAAFQEECPIIVKSKAGATTNTGRIVSFYAPLDVIVRQVKPLLKKHNFTYTIDTEPDPKGVHAYCIAHHTAGHEVKRHVFMPFVERTQVMTEAQVEMATMTIATRRVFCNTFGIMTGEADTDGKKEVQPITEEQIAKITNFFRLNSTIKPWIVNRYKIKELTELNTEQADYIINAVQQRSSRNRD